MPHPSALSTESLIRIVDAPVPDEGINYLLFALYQLFRIKSKNLFSHKSS